MLPCDELGTGSEDPCDCEGVSWLVLASGEWEELVDELGGIYTESAGCY